MDKGFLEEFGLVEEVVARWPGAVALRVAVPTRDYFVIDDPGGDAGFEVVAVDV